MRVSRAQQTVSSIRSTEQTVVFEQSKKTYFSIGADNDISRKGKSIPYNTE